MLQVLLYLHVLTSIGYGRFSRARVVTWVALILSWSVIPSVVAFAGFMLPWGQVSYWFASVVTDVLGVVPGGGGVTAWLFAGGLDRLPSLAGVGGTISLAVLGVDVAVMYAGLWRTHSALWVIVRVVLIVIACFTLAVLIDAIVDSYLPPAPPDPGPLTPAHIVPEWWLLPIYAILRSVPSKLLGLGLAFAALLIPLFAPLMRAWRFNADWRRWIWWPLCAGLLPCWVALGWMGAHMPDEITRFQTQVLTSYYFGFFLLTRSALGRLGPER